MYSRRLGLTFVSLQVGPQEAGGERAEGAVSKSMFSIKGIANQATGGLTREMEEL